MNKNCLLDSFRNNQNSNLNGLYSTKNAPKIASIYCKLIEEISEAIIESKSDNVKNPSFCFYNLKIHFFSIDFEMTPMDYSSTSEMNQERSNKFASAFSKLIQKIRARSIEPKNASGNLKVHVLCGHLFSTVLPP